MRQTKLTRLVNYLRSAATTNQTVTRATIMQRFGGHPAYVVYFNGLRRNGAITRSDTVNVHKINAALTRFRRENLARQVRHQAKVRGTGTASRG